MIKSILITGVKGGIGAAIAKVFREHNYYVYGMDKREEGNIEHIDRFINFDLHRYVRDVEYRIRASEELELLVPSLHVLVNNAAVQRLDRLEDIKLDDWQETLNVNLTGPMLLSKLFLKRLEDSRGSIINIASIHHILTKPGFLTYATSKNALVGLTKAMAVDLEGRVRVNAISPAAIDTPMLREGFDNSKQAIEELKKIHPVKKIGVPEEVARLALFLASENEGFLHGSNILIDGGISSVLKDL
jgi:NAD(P)-dependent dehydrogenase (short-subunit alcohol dehydrogenase family)